MTLETMLKALHYRKAVEEAVKASIRKNTSRISELAKTAYDGENFDFPLCRRMPLTRLAVLTFLLVQKYADYHAMGVPDEMIFDTFQDVSLRAELYFQKSGKPGITKVDVIWFRHIIHTAIFKIGPLQYQPFAMVYLDQETLGEPYMTFDPDQKKRLPPGTPVINCHIPQGADLSAEAVEDSMAKAKKFFAVHFPGIPYRAFLCYSWLLYPPMAAQLPKDSNIRQFARRFTILGSLAGREEAKKYIEKRNPPTTLEIMFSRHRDWFGFSCGIMEL